MSDTYFSKLDPKEKESRLVQLATSRGRVTIWIKGQKSKLLYQVIDFEKDRLELLLDSKDKPFPKGTKLLCSFELRGMYFFGEVAINESIVSSIVLEIKGQLYKSEKRASYRLLTYPIYDVYAEFQLEESYEGSNVVGIKNRTTQTGLFKNFLKLLEAKDEAEVEVHQLVKYRVQDLSTTGMSLHVGELEAQYFSKNYVFQETKIIFPDQVLIIPEVKVVYVVNYITGDKNVKKYKVGLHFPNMPTIVDESLGKKINELLREIDFNKDFENFSK